MSHPPAAIGLLRLSALGDVTHVLPLVHRIRRHWPGTAIHWVIGKAEQRLLDGLPGVTFHVYDKRSGWAGLRALRAEFAGLQVDVLLQMQLALRANLVSLAIPARSRLGYDRARSKEGHGLVIDRRIAPGGHHVLDVFARFGDALGLPPGSSPVWDLPVPDDAHAWAAAQWPEGAPMLAISPCSSHALRNWRPERYAAVADHAVQRGWRVALLGGRSAIERETGDAILAAMRAPALDLIGRDTLKQLPALLARADLLLSPDSGPMHIANAMGTPVIGLHACTDAERSGPYSDRRYCVNHYDAAARRFLGRPASALRWGQRVERPGVMDLIGVDEVIDCFERFRADCGI